MNAQTHMLLSKRRDFVGRTDRYYSKTGADFETGAFDITSTFFDDKMRDAMSARINRYKLFWRYYNGKHHQVPMVDGEPKPVFNYCRTIVNKHLEFLIARGIDFQSVRGNEQCAEEYSRFWQRNNSLLTLKKISLQALVTGDGYGYVNVETVDAEGKALPKKEWKVTFVSIPSGYVIPKFRGDGTIEKAMIQFPSSRNPQDHSLTTILLSDSGFQVSLRGEPFGPVKRNAFGKINLVYFPNMGTSDSNFGVSDLEDIVPLNDSLNEAWNTVMRTIRYHGEPTTIVQGARVSSLEKGAHKVWSNLPTDGKIFNLEMQSDSDLVMNAIEKIKESMLEISCTPKVAIDGSDMPHSNSSGVALELMFKPILDRTNVRRLAISKALKEVADLVITAHEQIIGDRIYSSVADYKEDLTLNPIWTSNMPRDEKLELEIAKLKYELGIISKQHLRRMFGDKEDTERAAIEIAADQAAELAVACETARANTGMPPILSSVLLDSISSSEDLSELVKAYNEADKLNPEPVAQESSLQA